MEGKKVTKIHKPSGLRPPQIRVNKPPASSQHIKSESTTAEASSKVLRRRSKSVIELQNDVEKSENTESTSGSKLRNPSSLKPPHAKKVKIQPLCENIINISPVRTVPTFSRMLPRRSKSASDLRLIGSRPKAVPKASNQVQRTVPVANKIAQKRKGDKPSDEIKPKIVKQAKIPDWDYKGRYNQLREKFSTLNEDFKKQRTKLEDYDILEEKYNTLKSEYDDLINKFTALTESNTNTASENNVLKEEVSRLNETVSTLKRERDELKQLKDKLTTENECLSEGIEKLTEENKTLSDDLSSLRGDHTELKERHEKLVDSHDAFKADYDKILTESGDLHQNLKDANASIVNLTEQNTALKIDINNLVVLRRKLHNTIQDLKGNIRVFCRVRPPVSYEEEERPQCLINVVDEKTIEIRKSRESISTISGRPTDIKAEFTADKIFEAGSSQMEIFEDLAQLVQSALDGYDVCVFAYGQTGSGKTYTMQGDETPERRGMIPRTVDLIFDSIENLRRASWTYEISASFLEIYNENVRDLLNPNPNQNLEIRFNEGKGTTVTNLSIQKLDSPEELKHFMKVAQRNRAVAATDFNEHSSRSHAITKIYLQGTNERLNVTYAGSINLVDLAGSESAKTSSNERLTETKNINKSLSALESVMLALYNKEKHIPYRNSKLTYLLQSCLGGNSKTLMVVNIAPFEECYMESIYSLRFAAKVKEVKMTLKRNKTACGVNNKS